MNHRFPLLVAVLLALTAICHGQSIPGTPNFPGSIDDNVSLFGQLTDNPQTVLNGTITGGSTTITVVGGGTAGFGASGSLKIDNETIYYTGKTSNTFTGCLRGRDGTSATTHVSGSAVKSPILSVHHRTLVAAIIATENLVADAANDVDSFNGRQGAVTLTSGDVATALSYTPVRPSLNLSDLSSPPTARANLGLGTMATQNATSIGVTGGTLANITCTNCTNVGSSTNGAFSATNDEVINFDSDANASGVFRLQRGGVDKLLMSNDGTVAITATTTAPIADKGGQVFNVQAYGWLPDNTDHSVQALAMLSAICPGGVGAGGTVYFPPSTGKYRADSQLFIPNDGASPQPHQCNLRFAGAGGGANWYVNYVSNASTLDLRYQASDGNAKIESRGLGAIVFENLTFVDGGSVNDTPFMHFTNTVPTVRSSTFRGSHPFTSNPLPGGYVRSAQDAIVLGSASSTIDGSVTSPFQGYCARIDSNSFSNLNRGVYGRWYANCSTVTNNSFIENTGTVAIEFSGRGSGGIADYGMIVTGNSIEMNVYMYGVKLTNVTGGLFSNSFYDAGDTTLAGHATNFYHLTTSPGNTFMHLTAGEGTISPPMFGGDSASLASLTSIGGLPPPSSPVGSQQTDAFNLGNANAEFGNNVVIRGDFNAHYGPIGYPGQLTLASAADPRKTLRMGYNNVTGDYGFIDASDGIGNGKPLLLNPTTLITAPNNYISAPVGIGNIPIASLARPLHVGVDSFGGGFRVGDATNTNYFDLTITGSNTTFKSSGARNFVFNNGTVDVFKLASNRDIILDQGSGTGRNRLYVNASGYGARIGDSTDTNYLDIQVGGTQTAFFSTANRPMLFSANGVVGLQVDGSGVLSVYNGSLQPVTFGAADSCGTGFKCMRIPN